jgi:hypothetical protein
MGLSNADYVLLLNSDTIVASGWLDRLVACAESETRIGVVGPLSNTASWQSVPEVLDGDDWARNELPDGVGVDAMAAMVVDASARLYPKVSFLNGFCLLIKRSLIEDIGTFDEERFGEGYGEENDFCLRARAVGWDLAVADDTFVYHAQSKSYSDERRHQLYERADTALADKHGRSAVESGVAEVRDSRVLRGVRAGARSMLGRRALVDEGRERFAGRSVLFVLPVMSPGGGANIVISEAQAMLQSGPRDPGRLRPVPRGTAEPRGARGGVRRRGGYRLRHRRCAAGGVQDAGLRGRGVGLLHPGLRAVLL